MKILQIFANKTTLTIYDELPNVNGISIMKEYTKKGKKTLQIGIKIEDADQVIVTMENKQISLTRSHIDRTIWHQVSNDWIEDNFDTKTEACFGINACGKCEVIAYNAQGQILSKKSVLIIPSQFSLEQYVQMQIEVKSLFEVLAFDLLNNERNDQKLYLRDIQIPLYDLDKMNEIVSEFSGWVEQIFESPAEKLDKVFKKVHHSKVKKWTSKALINQALYPFNERVLTDDYEKSNDVIEHQMIRGMIEEMIDRMMQEKNSELFTIQRVKKDLEIRKQNLQSIRPSSSRIQLSEDQLAIEKMLAELSERLSKGRNEISVNETDVHKKRSIKEHLELKIIQLKEEVKILEKRQLDWVKNLDLLNNLLDQELLNVPSQLPENTHLFSMEPKYSAVFDCYEEFLSIRKKLDKRSEIFIESILKSPHLYEVWILLQIIRQLACWKFDTSHTVQELLKTYNSSQFGSLKGVNIKFIHKSNDAQVRLMYNAEVSSRTGGILTPDYILMFRSKETDIWDVHTLDAKYKPYTNFSRVNKNLLVNDLEHSASRYLNEIIENPNYEIRSAALVHTDVGAEHWNLYDCYPNNDVYRLSHFHVLPGDVQSLHVYLKRIFHYFGRVEELCPSCGDKVVPVQIEHKPTYICPNDNEVWVRNRCKCTWRMQHRPPLYKYASANYNVQVKNEWNVYCPICNEDVNNNVLRQDVFGRTLG